ncbi:DUF2510 domain-containing protein [Georgenia phoenicis]|uniref:DUF2510 domain-containing protein n=1 Tax=unclassified Georgenia TaxID=2626815 RepID=UPI0039AEBFFA
MSNPIAGWYPDPSGDQSKLRYWDGTSWTEHFAPAQGAAQQVGESGPANSGQQTAPHTSGQEAYGAQPTEQLPTQGGEPAAAQPTEQFPAQASEQPGSQHTAVYPTGQYGQPAPLDYGQQQPAAQQDYGQQQPYGQYPAGQAPYGQSPYAAPGQDPYGQQPGSSEGGSGKGLVIGIIIAAVVLIAAAVTAVVLLLGSDDESEPAPRPAPTSARPDPTFDDPTEEPSETTGGTVSGGELALDASATGEIAAGETWTATLTVEEATPVVIDVLAESGDLVLTVTGGDVDVENDDNGDFPVNGAASSLDPAVGVYLEPGVEYEVAVRAYSSVVSTPFTITTAVPQMVTPGEPIAVDLAEDEVWLGAIELTSDSTVVMDSVSSEGDAQLGVYTSTGDLESSDDSDEGSGGTFDPYLELDLPAGVHLISYSGWRTMPLTAELTITVQ